MATTVLKRAGIPVFTPQADPFGDCVLRELVSAEPWRSEREWPVGFDGGISHRLDTSTSGALVVADSLEELEWLRREFAEHRFKKTYWFLAARSVTWSNNACELPIAHSSTHKGRMAVLRGQKTPHRGRWYPARTEFRRIEGELFEAVMFTGVMHQIRVHAAFLGIPLRGDRRYGGGPPIDADVEFCLHHVGLEGPEGFRSAPVALPDWAKSTTTGA